MCLHPVTLIYIKKHLHLIIFSNPKMTLLQLPQLKVGDVVRIISDAKQAEILQRKHGGWVSEMEEVRTKYSSPLNYIVHIHVEKKNITRFIHDTQ